ncbi:MAG: MarR family transcriptional regulator [Clostridiales bacterium]|nr:MarR family transcriptional regulator [Clostridiales bacterium]
MNKRLIYEVKAVSNIVKRTIDGRLSKDLKYEQLTTSQCKILNYLSANEDSDIYQKDIEKVFSIRRSTATKTLQLMEKNGLLLRAYSSKDARLKKLILTDKAKALAKNISEVVNEIEAKAENGVTEQEKELFLSIMEKIKNNLSD